jgi:hypothetical protein
MGMGRRDEELYVGAIRDKKKKKKKGGEELYAGAEREPFASFSNTQFMQS